MKKISREILVGSVAIIIIVLFFWLFSYLKGRNILSNTDNYYIYYSDVAGLNESSPVEINGLKAGVVGNLSLVNDGSGVIEAIILIEKGYKIPDNSVAEITTASLIAGMKIELIPGTSKTFLKPGETLQGRLSISILDKLDNEFSPVVAKTTLLIDRLDTLVKNINSVFNDEFGRNIENSVANLSDASGELNSILKENREGFTELISDIGTLGDMLESNQYKLDSTISNVYNITSAFSESEIDSTIKALQLSLENSSALLQKLNNGEGSAGKILNDDSLYLNLSNSLNSLNLLLIEMEKNPDRFVHFSIFGKKNK